MRNASVVHERENESSQRSRGLRRIREGIHWRLSILRHRLQRWFSLERVEGRIVAWRGNWIELDGCRFDVSHPSISNIHRARLARGTYERSERALLLAWLDDAAPVIELGGGIGIVATLINRRLQIPANHVVVEANPLLIPVLERQKAANGAAYAVEHAAVDYSGAPTTTFGVGPTFISGRLNFDKARKTFVVPTTTLASLLRRYPWRGATLICDIEGQETQMVAREGELLSQAFTSLLIEVHPEVRSNQEYAAFFSTIEALGFSRVASLRTVHVYRKSVPPGKASLDGNAS
jgi:FkbM family methyltransferase